MEVLFTTDKNLMKEFVNKPLTTALAIACAVIIIFLYGPLLYEAFGGEVSL